MTNVDIYQTDLTTPEGRAHWHRLRSQCLGSSEIPIFMGHGYSTQTAWSVWHDKVTGEIPQEEEKPDHLWFGQQMQRTIGQATALQLGLPLREGRQHWRHQQHRLGCSIDFYAYYRMLTIIEAKNRTSWYLREASTDDLAPPHDVIQLACQCFLAEEAGWQLAPLQYVSAAVDGQRIQIWGHRLDQLRDLYQPMIDHAHDFWAQVEARIEPDPQPCDLPAWMAYHNVDLAGTLTSESKETDALVATYRQAAATRLAAETEEKAARAKLQAIIGDHETLVTANWQVRQRRWATKEATITRKAGVQSRLDCTFSPVPDDITTDRTDIIASMGPI